MKNPTIKSQIGAYDRLEGRTRWRILKSSDHPYIRSSTLAGHLILYAWNLIERMEKPLTFDRFYELLEQQAEDFLETSRSDAVYNMRKIAMTKRKTYPHIMYKIEIGSSQFDSLATIFAPSILQYSKKIDSE